VILDEAYIEFQTNDDPDASLDLLKDFPNLVVLRTFSKCYGLAGLRVGYAIGSSNFRAAVDAVRQPFSVNALAQAAGAEAILHQDDVLTRVESTVAERLKVQEGVQGLGLPVSESQATTTKRRCSRASPRQTSRCAPVPRSAIPATSGSATAPPRRTTASSPRLPRSSGSARPPLARVVQTDRCEKHCHHRPGNPDRARRDTRPWQPHRVLLAI
jgi:histidinol-phosphate aminotransferase